MQRQEINQVTMLESVITVLAEHQETVNAFAPLAEVYPRLEASVAEVKECDREYTEISTGLTVAKMVAETAMVEKAMHVARAMSVLSVKTGNEPLRAETDVTANGLLRMRQTRTLQYCTRLSGIAREYVEELAVYGVTGEMLDELDAAIEQVKSAVADQVNRNAQQKTARLRLSDTLESARAILKSELDFLIELVKVRDPSLYDQYKAVRGVRNLGKRHAKRAAEVESQVV